MLFLFSCYVMGPRGLPRGALRPPRFPAAQIRVHRVDDARFTSCLSSAQQFPALVCAVSDSVGVHAP